MSRNGREVSRRKFIGSAALAAAGTALAAGAAGRVFAAGEPPEEKKPGAAPLPAAPPASKPRSKVVLVRDPKVLTASGALDAAVAAKMLDDAVCELTGAKKPGDAWRQLFGPKDVAGIKSNVWRNLMTPPEVEAALRSRIAACGIPEATVKVTDRGAIRELGPCTALLNIRPARSHHWAGLGGCIKNYIMFVEDPPF
jgi:hypothetical protein